MNDTTSTINYNNLTTATPILTVNKLAPFWFNILPIIIIIFGLIGNTITTFVLSMKRYTYVSTCFYMKTLALSDSILLILFFVRWLSQFQNVNINQDHFCITFFFAKRVTLGTSTWILMLMTLDKYLSSRFPLHAKRLCTIKRARVCLFIIILVYMVIHVPYFWRYSNLHAITLSDKCPFNISGDFVRIFTVLRIVLIDSVLPWLLTSLFTILMSRELYLNSKASRKLRINVVNKNTPKKVKYMAIFDSWAFFFLTFPTSALDVTRLFTTVSSDKALYILYESFVYLLHLKSGIHFYLYIMVSKTFRNNVILLFSKKKILTPSL